MSDNVTIARPYAKAIFNHALREKQLVAWSIILQELAHAVLDPNASSFINNPGSAVELQSKLLLFVLEKSKHGIEQDPIEKWVNLLAENKRLLLLPDISAQFEELRAEQEKTMTVNVTSFAPLTTEQQQRLIQSLSQRLQRQVMLDMKVDKSLLGGAVIHAGDLVINGSVVEKLTKLGAALAA